MPKESDAQRDARCAEAVANATRAANQLVDRKLNQLKKAQQAAGNGPLALDGESFRKDFKADIRDLILAPQGVPCPPRS